MSHTMKAVRLHAYGDSSVLRYEDADIPKPGEDDVLVKVHAAGVNPVDWKVRAGYLQSMIPYDLPLIPGWDVAGEIVAMGEHITDWKIGDAIYSRPDIARQGSYAEYVAVRASEISKKPASLDWLHAAAVPLAALTAWQVLFEHAKLRTGERVLIHAGAGGVGLFAIQLAKIRGAHVTTTTSTRNVELVQSMGADTVIDYSKEDFRTLRDLDVVFDTLGGNTQVDSWQTLKRGGQLMSIVDTPDAATAARHGVQAQFCFVQPSSDHLRQIAELIDTGQLKVTLDSVYPLAEAAQAQEKSESGRARGKIVLQVA